MKWILIGLGVYVLYRIVKRAAPPKWPSDEDAKRILIQERRAHIDDM
jgi:hypothetical protein